MAVKEIQVIQENGSVSKDNIMATYLGDDTNNYTYDSLKEYINNAVGNLNEKISTFAGAMIFKGTLGSSGTVKELPTEHYVGWTYRVVDEGTWAGVKCEVGDMITCIAEWSSAENIHWAVYQSNIDGAVVGPATAISNNIPIFADATGKVIIDSGKSLKDILRMPINPSQAEIDLMEDGAFYLVY